MMKKHYTITLLFIFAALLLGGASIVFALNKLIQPDSLAPLFNQSIENSRTAIAIPPQETPINNAQEIPPSMLEPVQKTPTQDPPSKSSALSFILIDVPFIMQAPTANWEEPYQNFCEEAAALMTAVWAQKRQIFSKILQEKELNTIKEWEIEQFGDYVDTDAGQTARILTDFFGIKNVKVEKDPSINDIKAILIKGGIVIVPTAGRELKNPNFRGQGPLYHMLVIRGFDDTTKEFITNDPGTRKGEKYRYSYQILDKSITNWYSSGRTIRLEDRQIIAVYKN